MTAAEIADALGGHQNGDSWSARCPAHDDHDPSLSLTDHNGRVLVRCFAGCSQTAVIAALRERGLWPATRQQRKSRVVARYDYTDESGALLFQVERLEPKSFRQRRPDKGGWLYKLDGVRRVLYRLPELLATPADALVFIVEGEKDVDALHAVGLTATCNPGGAGKWRAEYDEHLRNRHVVVIPDADETGRRHADDVVLHLLPIAASVRCLELPR